MDILFASTPRGSLADLFAEQGIFVLRGRRSETDPIFRRGHDAGRR